MRHKRVTCTPLPSIYRQTMESKVTMTMTVLIFIVVPRLTGYRLLVRIHTDERSDSVSADAGTQSIGILVVRTVIAFVDV